ncbi:MULTISPECIES: molecular chaperone HtpG [unclassified Streptomyces]|uniref:molecular chaperone HtpG n=1 Tax=unclassified Streptomyces TaxID=2593676 RepID=UPI0001C1A2DD|nr:MULTISPECIES: molecular chaperone HtpG [unclassified Streptomyces]AEN10912.1 Heat shock protein Hsp90-like protein [Streptomyces sp. SirexAA-E]MYR69315.1 molecular chaperone HtpG [Streptomyces sp. SID4939]MYS01107.1 molecular chaperone HtpG [Streptomyces sp. SID4940]MYT63819.1 molecular chaperone HtpG [Streptomyces sp. SID8357]MYT86069.1 molecular chaperone HtpG [Streptomyces sp. SID8360]
MPAETFEFQVEARQLLQMMIHSIYSNKDVFLRELISNSSDALDKLRLETLRDDTLQADTSDLHISIEADKEKRTLTVRDNGIGMSHDEVVQLIGTIANSGTAKFLRELKEAKDAAASEELIGQFGVGFYASFMVADEVTLVTRRAGESQGTRWNSDGEGTYTVESVDDAPQGTSVTLRLKPEDTEDQLFDYTSPWKLREIVKRYSDFITWPIRMAAAAPGEDGAEPAVETVNSMKALWARSKDSVTAEEYSELYKHISHDWTDPLETIRMQAEGTFEYQALLFLPSHAPQDLFMQGHKRGVQLYVKRVFIMDDCEALMPTYLRFVKGVVDAQDLSLNVSREILQQDRQIEMMRRRLVKKVLSTVKEMMSASPENYRTFWKEFGRVLKEGLLQDFENRDALLEVSSFASTQDEEGLTTLRSYVDRMKEGQDQIYFMTGESRAAMESSPHMEAFRAKGLEVLLLTDPVDEVWVQSVPEFDGKQLQSIAKGEVDLDSDEEKEKAEAEREQRQQEYAGLLAWMTEQLGDSLKEVRLSSRLTVSPACIVSDTHDVTPALENMYRAMGEEVPHIKRILELNPSHALISSLRKAHAALGSEPDAGTELAETAELVHGLALLSDGGELSDPARFSRLMADRLERTL